MVMRALEHSSAPFSSQNFKIDTEGEISIAEDKRNMLTERAN